MNRYQPPGFGGPPLRIGDAERNDATQLLGEHFAEGRLTREEYDERCAQAFAARTAAELLPLFHDLPGPRPEAGVLVPFVGGGVVRPAKQRPRPLLPFLPVLLVLIGLAILLDRAWVVPIGLAVWLLLRNVVVRRPQASGSRRPPRGSWS
ncbi:DUF1707 domain-containing protein [Nocardioides sp.]|uniref:DUF1707 SHOCT-like domain-containing protein n=1 Tax=Nocardioides sp. TaxID=35761 RepID=UPI002733FADB|nr:DUF1707 domain-containing protein [Nocardioides sp.]MDP3891094.1 DUF1707 domain-containing protein [Nocardioides sp.]